jgi:AraC family transcriptional regulator of adaptative response/methylated-DNA-[protein]-cysteine methyltransferase
VLAGFGRYRPIGSDSGYPGAGAETTLGGMAREMHLASPGRASPGRASPGTASPGNSLDRAVCDRARLARDPAYDGKFFTGVRTTRIYCRPVCPVRPAQSRNVAFFPTAAAERAGFRPCLRCRPESAPGSPAWSGTATTVARGMRLIDDGFLDHASVEALAEKLGIGPRHLLRLFLRHAGATPSEVASTRRVQRAKRLIDQTTMPLSRIAYAAGFGSVRRFNDAFLATYARPPSSFRRRAEQT